MSSLLKPGGYFFGITPDSSTIWYGIKIVNVLYSSSSTVVFLYITLCKSFCEVLAKQVVSSYSAVGDSLNI